MITSKALWLWNTSGSVPVVSGYPIGGGAYAATKTGLTSGDLQNFLGVPLQYYGNPPTPVDPAVILGWIRTAEDTVEQDTTILLCQNWIAAAPAQTFQQVRALQMTVTSPNGVQEIGYDYDRYEPAYDFMYSRAQDEGWMYQTLRYRPVQSMSYSQPNDYTAVKNIAFVYPLQNSFMNIPRSWIVEDRDFGLVRLVPAADVAMLPLYSMQLALMGFAENVPGGVWYQYTAGLTPNDYQANYSFMKQYVLCEAALLALNAIQISVNYGAKKVDTMVDGLRQSIEYSEKGPFAPFIASFEKLRDKYNKMAVEKISGPMVNSLF